MATISDGIRYDEVSRTPGILLGLGLGGFADGILLHQVAQWHHMGSAVLPPTTLKAVRQNMLWDGWFHVATLVLTTVGVFLLLRDARADRAMPSTVAFTGFLLLGWGLFNLVEGLVDHHLLGIHHVRDMPMFVPAYDWLFLGVGGVGLMSLGWFLSRGERAAAVP